MQTTFTTHDIDYQVVQPVSELNHLVESFWLLTNKSDEAKPVIVLPDGRIDVSFEFNEPESLVLLGLESGPSQASIPPKANMFSISFRPMAAEHVFKDFLPLLPDSITVLPADYFGVSLNQFQDLEQFSMLLTEKLLKVAEPGIDNRKIALFDLIYASNGSISVQELSEKVFWSSRQINRYFHNTLGISLKAYCNILRFRASFQHIKAGRLSPEENYADQSHFIREIKRYAGVVPKDLARNKNDRFIQFSTLSPE